MSRILRHPHSYRKFPVECENHCLQAEIFLITHLQHKIIKLIITLRPSSQMSTREG